MKTHARQDDESRSPKKTQGGEHAAMNPCAGLRRVAQELPQTQKHRIRSPPVHANGLSGAACISVHADAAGASVSMWNSWHTEAPALILEACVEQGEASRWSCPRELVEFSCVVLRCLMEELQLAEAVADSASVPSVCDRPNPEIMLNLKSGWPSSPRRLC